MLRPKKKPSSNQLKSIVYFDDMQTNLKAEAFTLFCETLMKSDLATSAKVKKAQVKKQNMTLWCSDTKEGHNYSNVNIFDRSITWKNQIDSCALMLLFGILLNVHRH